MKSFCGKVNVPGLKCTKKKGGILILDHWLYFFSWSLHVVPIHGWELDRYILEAQD